MLHIALHFVVPAVLALAIDRERWLRTWLILVATMLVDLDHLLADPVYDPARCSIGFHPLHTTPAIVAHGLVLFGPRALNAIGALRDEAIIWTLQLVGLGLIVHMVLDGIDCLT